MPFLTEASRSLTIESTAWSLVWGKGLLLIKSGVGEDLGNGLAGSVFLLCSNCLRFCFWFFLPLEEQ